ncbi:MAG: M2 family metallopeptidase [Thermoplasmata archaeon]
MATAPIDAVSFLRGAEQELLDSAVEATQADWVHATYITDDTQALAARANARLMSVTLRLAQESTRLPRTGLSAEQSRKVKLLRLSLPLAAPSEAAASLDLARTVAEMQGIYAKGRHAPIGEAEPVDLQALSRILLEVRDPLRLEDAWVGWHRVGREIRAPFVRYVELANRGARELGFPDTGAMWRSRYDMEPEAFSKEVDRLWEEVRPLYDSLHAYVRGRLRQEYGPDRVPEKGPIPAHLLGNMWAQSWEGILPLVAPPGSEAGFDLTRILVDRGTTAVDMVRFAEQFFVSLGVPKLPPSFWERSMFLRPRDREVICHASAWDLDFVNDLRIKMCIEITADDFATVHHELGHNFYQRACSHQPFLFREGAHDGFHEAVGDTISLSVTPEYLVRIGLLESAPEASRDIGLLLHRALEKVAFLPFGLLVDRWRWEVFAGRTTPADYNRTWWELREKIQGIAPPSPRSEADFDPGAKFHVPSSVPYMRYFLAHILQFQFHRALAKAMGATGPLHRVSIYGSPEAGARLRAMLEMGAQHEWPDALEAITGERRMDARGLLEYFAPLQRWLDEQNRAFPKGW